MKTIKERTINELRQVKDTNYQPPLSHEKVREEKNAYGVVDHLLAAYKILSEEDKKPFGGSRALSERIKQVSSELATGLRTEANITFIKELAETFKDSGKDTKVRIAKERSKQFSKANKLLDEKEILEMLAPQFTLEEAKQGEDQFEILEVR